MRISHSCGIFQVLNPIVKSHSYWLHLRLCPLRCLLFSLSKASTGVSVYDRINHLTVRLSDLSPLLCWRGS